MTASALFIIFELNQAYLIEQTRLDMYNAVYQHSTDWNFTIYKYFSYIFLFHFLVKFVCQTILSEKKFWYLYFEFRIYKNHLWSIYYGNFSIFKNLFFIYIFPCNKIILLNIYFSSNTTMLEENIHCISSNADQRWLWIHIKISDTFMVKKACWKGRVGDFIIFEAKRLYILQ